MNKLMGSIIAVLVYLGILVDNRNKEIKELKYKIEIMNKEIQVLEDTIEISNKFSSPPVSWEYEDWYNSADIVGVFIRDDSEDLAYMRVLKAKDNEFENQDYIVNILEVVSTGGYID